LPFLDVSTPQGFYLFMERGWLSSNNIVFVGREQTAVVDTGYASHAPQTLQLLQAALQGRRLDLIINTHLHSDHCGGNALLQTQFPQAQTFIPPGHAQDVARWDEVALSYAPTGQSCPRFRYDALLQAGQSIVLGDRAWEIHAAPGHDPESVILFEPESRTLISADALWENGFGVIFQELERHDAFATTAATLDLIERLAPTTIIPGHGCVFHDLAPALLRARTRLEKFVKYPARHAHYGAKVLLKYKLLEWQQCNITQLRQWHDATPYNGIMHRNFFNQVPRDQWLEDLIADLVRSGAARREGNQIFNRD
jgi:glyoxylase-like metal-dependent hydrolase (beta-lactamase superfamily II)